MRLAALFHDLGKPLVGWRGRDGRLHYYAKPGFAAHGHDQVGADLAAGALRRLRYPNALRQRVVRIVRRHMFQPGKGDARRARRFLRRNGDELAFDLLDHKHADLLGKRGTDGEPPPLEEIDALLRFRTVVTQECSSPHRIRDLAVDGNDLIKLGIRPGPQLGRILHELLDVGRRRARAQHARRAALAGEGARVIRWEIDGYVVAFTTRVGGVSEGPYASLNLGRKSGDELERADENRRIACDALGADVEKLALNYQVHSDRVLRATAGQRGEHADGLWTDEPGLPILAMSADCLPIAARAHRREHACRRRPPRRLEGAARRNRRRGRRGAWPGARSPPRSARPIGPCCYEVGEEVAAPFRGRFGEDVVRDSRLDLWTSAERALRAAGVERVERVDRCTACEPETFFSHRRDAGRTGRQGVIAYVAG